MEGASQDDLARAKTYKQFPLASSMLYNLSTVAHYLLGALGLWLAYDMLEYGYLIITIYLFFAFTQMYVLMPIMVCPNCVYYRLEGGRCVTGLNIISRRLTKEGRAVDFPKRGQGLLCHNTLYIGALIIPIIGMMLALPFNFSWEVLALLATVAGLMIFRIFVVFFKVACLHCLAKFTCPNAISMGLDKS